MSKPIIEVSNLRKEFRILAHKSGMFGAVRNLFSRTGRTLPAIDGISFTIEAGEFTGYVGPNGAGKSTTIKTLAGILVPTSGDVRVDGLVPYKKRTENARRIGVIFGQRTQLWWDLPAIEGFHLLGKIYDVDSREIKKRIDYFVDLLELDELLDQPVRKLSLGQKTRCELVGALLHRPKLLFLDEPTIGLDIVAKQQVREFLLRINREEGTTILLTSHDLDDIEQLCRRILVIDKGKLIHDGTVASLKTHFGNRRKLVLDLASDSPFSQVPDGATLRLQRGRRIEIEFDADRLSAPNLIRQILDHHDIVDLQLHESDIEDVVRRIYQNGS